MSPVGMGVDSWEEPAHLVEATMAIVPLALHPHPPQHIHVFTLLPFSALPGHAPDISGGTSCTTHCLAFAIAFHCSWPSSKPANRPSRAGWGRLKGERGAESQPCSQDGCLPAQDGFLQFSFSGTPTSPGPGAGTPACQELCFERRNREGLLVFFSGALAPPPQLHPGYVITIRYIRCFNSN